MYARACMIVNFLYFSSFALAQITSSGFYKSSGSLKSCQRGIFSLRSKSQCGIECAKDYKCKAFQKKNSVCVLASCIDSDGTDEIYSKKRKFFITDVKLNSVDEAKIDCETVVPGAGVAEPADWEEMLIIKGLVRNSSHCISTAGGPLRLFYIGLKNPSGEEVTRESLPFIVKKSEFWRRYEPSEETETNLALFCPETREKSEGLVVDFTETHPKLVIRAVCQV